MRNCPSFPGYSATEDGRIFTHRKRERLPNQHGGTWVQIKLDYRKELKAACYHKKGYLTVSVALPNGKNRPVGVHQLICDAFLGPIPEGREVRHLDGNPTNNHLSNLAYGTSIENAQDRISHGRYYSGDKHQNAKLTQEQADEIRELRKQKVKVKDISVKFGVNIATIESIIYNKSYIKV